MIEVNHTSKLSFNFFLDDVTLLLALDMTFSTVFPLHHAFIWCLLGGTWRGWAATSEKEASVAIPIIIMAGPWSTVACLPETLAVTTLAWWSWSWTSNANNTSVDISHLHEHELAKKIKLSCQIWNDIKWSDRKKCKNHIQLGGNWCEANLTNCHNNDRPKWKHHAAPPCVDCA